MTTGIPHHLVEKVGELTDGPTVRVVYPDQGAHGHELRKVVPGARGVA